MLRDIPMLPEHIDPNDCKPTDDGRTGHFIHKPTGLVFSMYPGWPDAPSPAPREVYANEAASRPSAVQTTTHYVVALPGGKRVTCADEASMNTLLAAAYGEDAAPAAAVSAPAQPTPEEVADHQAQIAAEEASEQTEIDEMRKRLEAQFGLGPEEIAETPAVAVDDVGADASSDPAAKGKAK